MSYVLDQAFKSEEPDGVGRWRAVVAGSQPGSCQYPAIANARGALGITMHAQPREDKSVTVRRLGIAPCEAAAAIPAGEPVCIADDTGRIKRAARATLLAGTVEANNAVRFSAARPGVAANLFLLSVVVSGNNTPFSHSISGNEIVINQKTNGAGAASGTAAEVIAYVNANADLAALLIAAHEGASNGTGAVPAASSNLAGGELGEHVIGIAQEAATAAGDIINVLLTPNA